MEVRDAAARSFLSVAKRYDSQGHLWIWKDGLGGYRGTDRVSGTGESLCQLLTEEEILANDDWEPMMSTDVDPQDRPIRQRHKAG
jgi:hypothetical protein